MEIPVKKRTKQRFDSSKLAVGNSLAGCEHTSRIIYFRVQILDHRKLHQLYQSRERILDAANNLTGGEATHVHSYGFGAQISSRHNTIHSESTLFHAAYRTARFWISPKIYWGLAGKAKHALEVVRCWLDMTKEPFFWQHFNLLSQQTLDQHSEFYLWHYCGFSFYWEFQSDSITNAMPKQKKPRLDWEPHKAEFKDHYLVQDRSFKAQMKYCLPSHFLSSPFLVQFSIDSWQFSSKAQYESELKKSGTLEKKWPTTSGTTLRVMCENNNSREKKWHLFHY